MAAAVSAESVRHRVEPRPFRLVERRPQTRPTSRIARRCSSTGGRGVTGPAAADVETMRGELSWEEQQRRERLESQADLFSIISTVEALEKAYVRDSIDASQYSDECRKLIGQFKTLEHMIDGLSVPEFMQRYEMTCPAARHRLLEIGVPATVEYMRGGENASGKLHVAVAETVQHFITAMDALKLGMVDVDQLQPHLSDLMAAINKIPTLPPNFEAKEKVRSWLQVLRAMQASDALSEEQVRQCLFDLESGYNEFHRSLQQ